MCSILYIHVLRIHIFTHSPPSLSGGGARKEREREQGDGGPDSCSCAWFLLAHPQLRLRLPGVSAANNRSDGKGGNLLLTTHCGAFIVPDKLSPPGFSLRSAQERGGAGTLGEVILVEATGSGERERVKGGRREREKDGERGRG